MFNIPGRKLTVEESSIATGIMKSSSVDRDPQSTTSDSDSPVEETPSIASVTGGGPWQLQQEKTHKTFTADVSYNLFVNLYCVYLAINI